jgi:hypothetical protein
VEVEVVGAKPGDHVVLNQNFDPGWSVNDQPAEPYRDAIAARLTAPSQRLTFRFWPRGLSAGLVVLALTLLASAAALYWRRARAATLSP